MGIGGLGREEQADRNYIFGPWATMEMKGKKTQETIPVPLPQDRGQPTVADSAGSANRVQMTRTVYPDCQRRQ
jgi:hypothetical protein